MTKSEAREKVRKLMAHAESARKIGNDAEANSYSAQAMALMRRYRVTKKSLRASPEVTTRRGEAKGRYKCSCGFSLSLDISAPEPFATNMINAMLGPHMGAGHELHQVG